MDIVNFSGDVNNDGLLKPENINPSKDLLLIGTNIPNARPGTGYKENVITIQDLLSLAPSGGNTNVENVGEGNGEIYQGTNGNTVELRTLHSVNNGLAIDTIADEVVFTPAIRIQIACGKVYFVADVDGYGTVAVEATSYAPDGPGSLLTVPSYLLASPNPPFELTASDLLAAIPPNATSYSISVDGGLTWTVPNADPILAVVPIDCSVWVNFVASAILRVTYSDCATNTSAPIPLTAKSPTPLCFNDGLAVELMPDGMGGGSIELWATDFDAGSFTPFGPITFSISRDGVNYFPSLIFTCADIPEGEQSGVVPVYLGVTNCTGAFDFCITSVILQDNMGTCNPI